MDASEIHHDLLYNVEVCWCTNWNANLTYILTWRAAHFCLHNTCTCSYGYVSCSITVRNAAQGKFSIQVKALLNSWYTKNIALNP